jgi:hypothetical protein
MYKRENAEMRRIIHVQEGNAEMDVSHPCTRGKMQRRAGVSLYKRVM